MKLLLSRFKIFSLLPTLVIIAAIPLTIFLVQRQQDIRQRASSISFATGFNISGITHYGFCEGVSPALCNDLFPYSRASDVDADLAEMQRMGATIVRVFAANNKITDQQAAQRLDAFLTKAAGYNILAIVSFIDYYHVGAFNPQGTDQYYEGSGYGGLLNQQFFTDGYKNEYKSFVQTVVTANKDHSNIYAWEPGNELPPNTAFMEDIATTIKSIDSTHPLATGFIGLNENLAASLPSYNIFVIHPYNGARGNETTAIPYLTSQGKRVIVEEVGYTGEDDRSQRMASEIDYWKNLGASAFLQWGFIANGLGDNGNGDSLFGMDTIWHCADYNQLFTLYQQTVGASITTPLPLPPNCPPTPTPFVCTPCAADVNQDGVINIYDLSKIGGCVGVRPGGTPSCSSRADVNQDGIIDRTDLDCASSVLDQQCVPSPTLFPTPTLNSKLYIDPASPISATESALITATGTTDCSTNISNPPTTGEGLVNCQQSNGFTCRNDIYENPKDQNPCWWQWSCSIGNPGTYTATFTAANNNNCTSTKQYTIELTTPTPIPTPTPASVTCTPCRANITRSGRVSINDMMIAARCMGKRLTDSIGRYSCQLADVDGNGQINLSDLNCVSRQFNQQCSSPGR